MEGKIHHLLRIYRTAVVLPFFFFMTCQGRRCFLPLDKRVKSKSTDCQKVNVQFPLQDRHSSEKQLFDDNTHVNLELHVIPPNL